MDLCSFDMGFYDLSGPLNPVLCWACRGLVETRAFTFSEPEPSFLQLLILRCLFQLFAFLPGHCKGKFLKPPKHSVTTRHSALKAFGEHLQEASSHGPEHPLQPQDQGFCLGFRVRVKPGLGKKWWASLFQPARRLLVVRTS